MFRAHVLIARRPKLYYTTSGIITLIGGRPLHRFIVRLYKFRALCAHHQEVKIVLYSIWYHHTVGVLPVHRLREDQSSQHLNGSRPSKKYLPQKMTHVI